VRLPPGPHFPSLAQPATGLPPYLAPAANGATLHVFVVPRSRAPRVAGVRGGALVVRLSGSTVTPSGNAALREFLARRLLLSARQIHVAEGERERDKHLLISGISAGVLAARVTLLLEQAGIVR
jgi:uncharacterized protein YggU (UPF0235/DUF167 family)